MRRVGLVALGALSVGAAQPAQPEATLPTLVGAQLTADDLWRAWPAAARSVGVEASVEVKCLVTLSGAPENCSATTGSKGSGFEAAAIGLVRSLKFNPATVAGSPVPLVTLMTIAFRCGTRCAPFGASEVAPPPLILFPAWTATPTATDIEAAYPNAAATAGVEGAATLLCRRRADGALDGCKVTEEAPRERGFGDASLTLVAKFAGPPAKNGQTGSVFVRVPVRFRKGAGLSSAATLVEGEQSPPASPRDPTPVPPAPSNGKRYYPKIAQRRELTGSVLMICRLQPDHSLKACAVARDTNPGVGFGEAAKQLSEVMRIPWRIVDGEEVRDDYVVVPTNFNIAG